MIIGRRNLANSIEFLFWFYDKTSKMVASLELTALNQCHNFMNLGCLIDQTSERVLSPLKIKFLCNVHVPLWGPRTFLRPGHHTKKEKNYKITSSVFSVYPYTTFFITQLSVYTIYIYYIVSIIAWGCIDLSDWCTNKILAILGIIISSISYSRHILCLSKVNNRQFVFE